MARNAARNGKKSFKNNDGNIDRWLRWKSEKLANNGDRDNNNKSNKNKKRSRPFSYHDEEFYNYGGFNPTSTESQFYWSDDTVYEYDREFVDKYNNHRYSGDERTIPVPNWSKTSKYGFFLFFFENLGWSDFF